MIHFKQIKEKIQVTKTLDQTPKQLSAVEMKAAIKQLSKKHKIPEGEIHIRCDEVIVDEYGHTEPYFCFIHCRQETNTEFKKRKDEAALRDAREFLHALGSVTAHRINRKEFVKIFRRADKYCKGRLVPDWQRTQVAEFFNGKND